MARIRFFAATLAVFAAGFVAGQIVRRRRRGGAGPQGIRAAHVHGARGQAQRSASRAFATTRCGSSRSTAWRTWATGCPTDAPASSNTLIYILAHDSRDAATKSWAAFREDPEWKAVSRSHAGERTDRLEGRVGVPRGDGFLAAEVAPAQRRVGRCTDVAVRPRTQLLCVAALGGLSRSIGSRTRRTLRPTPIVSRV